MPKISTNRSMTSSGDQQVIVKVENDTNDEKLAKAVEKVADAMNNIAKSIEKLAKAQPRSVDFVNAAVAPAVNAAKQTTDAVSNQDDFNMSSSQIIPTFGGNKQTVNFGKKGKVED